MSIMTPSEVDRKLPQKYHHCNAKMKIVLCYRVQGTDYRYSLIISRGLTSAQSQYL